MTVDWLQNFLLAWSAQHHGALELGAVAELTALSHRIRGVPSTDLGPETGHPKILRRSLHILQKKYRQSIIY
jgi:hypothetical protein